jgi:hypothetical protein
MRWVMLAGVLLATAWAEGNAEATPDDPPGLATAECSAEEFQDSSLKAADR